jgi:hypothetical protein
VLAALVKSSAARLLTEINIGLMDHDYPVDLQSGIDAICKAGKLEALQSVFIGDFEYPDEQELSWVEAGAVGKVLLIAPNLRSLHVRGGGIDIGKLEHDKLENLFLETTGLPKSAVGSVGKCKLPSLTRMEVWLGNDERGGDGNVKQLAELFKGTGVPKLEHLGLKNCEWQDEIAVALAKSQVLAQLKTLDLSLGTMHGAGAEAILANAAKFHHLEHIDLSRNFLSDEHVKQLRKAFGKKVDVSDQEEADDDGEDTYYYISVGE